MATVTGFTADRMLEIENGTVVSGGVNEAGGLILTTKGGTHIDAGNVKGETGDKGEQGNAGDSGIPGGTVATRSVIFGVPSTDEEKVFLANKAVSWLNITTGWFETYRATTGTPGLVVPGVAGAAGWYPVDASAWYPPDKQMTLSRSGFGWSSDQSWDAGTLGVDSTVGADTQYTHPMPTFCAPGSVSGSIKFIEPGIYDVFWYNKADRNPGVAGYRIVPIGSWGSIDPTWSVFGQADHPSASKYWETLTLAIGLRVPTANLEIRLTGIQDIATVNTPKVKVVKRGGSL